MKFYETFKAKYLVIGKQIKISKARALAMKDSLATMASVGLWIWLGIIFLCFSLCILSEGFGETMAIVVIGIMWLSMLVTNIIQVLFFS
jgi:hypothetical protein